MESANRVRSGEGSSLAKIILIAFAVILATSLVAIGKSVYDEKSVGTKLVNEITTVSPDIAKLASLGFVDSTKLNVAGTSVATVSVDGITGDRTVSITNSTGSVFKEISVPGFSVGPATFSNGTTSVTLHPQGNAIASAINSALAFVGFHTDTINHKFNKVSGIELNNGSWFLTADDDYVYEYHEWSDDTYRMNKDGSGRVGLGFLTSTLYSDGQYLYYKSNVNTKLIRVNRDGTSPLELSPGTIGNFGIAGNYVYFADGSDNYMRRINKDGTGLITVTGNIRFANLTTNGTYVFFRNLSGNKAYRMNMDGTGLNQISDIDIEDIASANGSDYVILKQMMISALVRVKYDGTEETVFDSGGHNAFGFDGTYAVYSDGTNLMKKDMAMNESTLSVLGLIGDSRRLYLRDGFAYFSYPPKLYKVNIANPEGYEKSDAIYESSEITNAGGTNVKIKVVADVPADTSYDFELANDFSTSIALAEGNNDVVLNGTHLGDWMMMGSPFDGSGLLPGDSIIIYKTGQPDILNRVKTVSPQEIILVNDSGISGVSGYGVKKKTFNYENLTLSGYSLDGTQSLDTATLFGTGTDKLYYKITLSSTGNLATPTITSVSFANE